MVKANKIKIAFLIFTVLLLWLISASDKNIKIKDEQLNKLKTNTQQLEQQKAKLSEAQKQLEQKKNEEIKKLQDDLQAKKESQVRIASASTIKTPQNAPVQVSGSGEEAMNWIISHEGGPTSVNPSSLACGLAQSLPCSKVLSFAGVNLASHNLNTFAGVQAAISTVPAETQREWMRQYCINRYGSLTNAKSFWQSHGWY